MELSEVRRARARIAALARLRRADGWAWPRRAPLAIVTLLGACWAVTYLAGGAGRVAPHWFYAPILLGASRFGRAGALLTALCAAALAGPLMPLYVATGTPQDLTDWLTRGAFFVAVGQLMFELIHRRRQAEQALAAHVAALEDLERQRRRLLARLLAAEEEERKRIAADLHDDPVQLLVAIGMRLATLRRRVDEEGIGAQLEELEEAVGQCSARLRGMVFELYPPELSSRGLGDAIDDVLKKFASEAGLVVRLANGLRSEPTAETCAIAYRLVLEALTNVRKHARASRVEVELAESAGQLTIRVEDDGLGFDPDGPVVVRPGHIGLKSMADRAELVGGHLRVDSAPGRGTVVQIRLPLELNAQPSPV